MADGETITDNPARKSDLLVRLASAAVMLLAALAALWMGGQWLDMFIMLVALATMIEFILLVVKATANISYRLAAILAGALYIGLATAVLVQLPGLAVAAVIGAVVAVDSFAYFFGRTIGGPKIAPSISPSKTWAGLLGGIVGASLWVILLVWFIGSAASAMAPASNKGWMGDLPFLSLIAGGAVIAVAAQAGDFLESWLKRKAGAKDSSNLIPGHGGVFDRTDGLIPVALIAGAIAAYIP